ncbi:VanZ family protein [Planococcus salinarum]|uniref:VanZ family protein n=1 Tax=Planococcus salinarum TaxID=622695 RepID=UPI000AE853C6|nr:VanZ family protein [Planococcus salinarum]
MRSKFLIASLLWAAGILIVMCTSSAHAFMYEQTLSYTLNFNPDFSDFFRTSDIDLTDSFYLLQKTGHILSFGILYILVFNWLRNHYKAFGICIFFAFCTEVLQLFFERNGRLFDVSVDLVGILLAVAIIQLVRINTAKAE